MGRRAQPRSGLKPRRRKKGAPQAPVSFVLLDFSDANFEVWLRGALKKVRTPRVRPA